ncbi:MAG: heterodisulfide reductase-related iron-sulfur binding cluster, partial [Nitrospinota bacterium]
MEEASRQVYWNIAGGGVVYLFGLLAVAATAWGFWRHARLWRLGGPEARWERIPERLAGVFRELFLHRRLLQKGYAGLAHLFIFYGFLGALIATTLLGIQEWSGVEFLKGRVYLWYSLLSDLAGLIGIAGILMALWRRWAAPPKEMPTLLDDWVALLFLLVIFGEGFFVEGLRIAATELRAQPEWAPWSPGGYVVALAFSGAGEGTLRFLHRLAWWTHIPLSFLFLAYLGWGKLNHILFSTLNIFFRNLDTSGKLKPIDFEDERIESFGASRIEEYSWKSLLDLDACTNCGRCEMACPATMSGVALSPRKLIQDMKAHLQAVGPRLLDARARGEGGEGAGEWEDRPPLIGAVREEELWGCRACGACHHECPVGIEHIPKMVDMRRYLVLMESKMSEDAKQFLKSMDERWHPWKGTQRSRAEWYQGLGVKELAGGAKADLLYWVGCTGALVDRNIEVSRALVKVLQAAGVDFAVLGAEEVCTGDPARRVGGEYTFQMCAKRNIETFEKYGVKKVLTTCPHCLNTLRNEYPDFGGRYEVVHHSEFIRDLLRAGRLSLSRPLEGDGPLTYHDPCYLGRHNGVYEQPREVLAAIPGARLAELPRNRRQALCCGAGGGYAWMDDAPHKRINHIRVEEVQGSGAGVAAVACPFCMQMFEDGLKAKDPEGKLQALDLAEIVAR